MPYFVVTKANFKAMIGNIVANRSSFYWSKLLKDMLTHSFQLQSQNSGKIF